MQSGAHGVSFYRYDAEKTMRWSYTAHMCAHRCISTTLLLLFLQCQQLLDVSAVAAAAEIETSASCPAKLRNATILADKLCQETGKHMTWHGVGVHARPMVSHTCS
jgi:hypothetical protein